MSDKRMLFTQRSGLAVLLAATVFIFGSLSGGEDGEGPVTAAERELADLINEARAAAGLPSVPLTASLMETARLHVADLNANRPDTGTDPRGLACNLHSWSDEGDWTPVCYTSDHHYSTLMWNKPSEITGVYDDNGYEIAHGGGGSVTPAGAMNGWKSSPAHLDVILERDIWTGCLWQSLGVAVGDRYAVAWFGEDPDPAGEVSDAGAPPSGGVAYDHPDPVAAYGGLSLELAKEIFGPGEEISFTVTKWSHGSADLTNSRYRIDIKTEDGWETFFRSGPITYRQGPILESGKAKGYVWNRKNRGGTREAKPGKIYRVKFYAPRTTAEVLRAQFKLVK
ncbi:MAG: CAP domain-containing protein [Candidatus Aminicenantes bacterium]|nr:CAP domain-containing protein [Candidatus Aminicenantes bacterium]